MFWGLLGLFGFCAAAVCFSAGGFIASKENLIKYYRKFWQCKIIQGSVFVRLWGHRVLVGCFRLEQQHRLGKNRGYGWESDGLRCWEVYKYAWEAVTLFWELLGLFGFCAAAVCFSVGGFIASKENLIKYYRKFWQCKIMQGSVFVRLCGRRVLVG